jgi:hypothetical protein
MNPFDPLDFDYPPLFPDPLEEQLRDFHYMDSMMDQCEKFIEQPPLPGDWRFPDRLGRDLARAETFTELEPILTPELLDWARNYGKQLPDLLESQIEDTVIPGATSAPDISSIEPLKPGGYVRPDASLIDEGCSGFYRELSGRVRYQVRGSRSGVRRSEEGDWCFDRQERITREDCEAGCSHWDSESMECKYFEDWERDHPPEEG